MIITTGFDPIPEIVQRAKALAEHTGTQFVPRGKLSVRRLVERYGDEEILVILQEAVRLITPGTPRWNFIRAWALSVPSGL